MFDFLGELAIVPFIVVLLILFMLFKAIRIVPQGFEWTVERLGKYTRTLKPGISILIPLLDTVGNKKDMREQVIDVPSQEVITRDNALVQVDGIVFFQVIDAAKSSYEVTDLYNSTLNLAMTNIRTVLGSMTLDECLSERNKINNDLMSVVDEAVEPWGVKITRIEIKDVTPPQDLVESMGRQMKAERDKRAEILEAEGSRQADILRAEGQKQAQVLRAEAMKEAAFQEAEGRIRAAEAEAEATRVVSEAISKGDSRAINYFVATKYVEALESMATSNNQKTLILPVEATNILGSLAGIKELFEQTTTTPIVKPAADNNDA